MPARHLLLPLLVAFACNSARSSPPDTWSVGGFSSPESVLWDDRADLYLVSNINGSASDPDDNGFISRVSPPPGPHLVDVAWIDGADRDVTLHGPKGMALAGELLYVVDVGAVRMFDRTTGEPRGMVDIPGMFVNDIVAAPAGDRLYVSVTGLDRSLALRGEQSIWMIEGTKATKMMTGPQLGGPNGLAALGDGIAVVGFGSGTLYHVAGGARTTGEKLPAGVLDGLVALPDGRFAVSSWAAAGVFIGGNGSWTRAPWTLPTPADIGYDAKRGLLLVPSFSENRIELHPVTP